MVRLNEVYDLLTGPENIIHSFGCLEPTVMGNLKSREWVQPMVYEACYLQCSKPRHFSCGLAASRRSMFALDDNAGHSRPVRSTS